MKKEILNLDPFFIQTYTFGYGIPLFLLPGWPYSGRIFQLLEPYLSDNFQITTIDLPNWIGLSRTVTSEKVHFEQYPELVKKVLEKIYPPDLAINIGGVSMGGTLALLASTLKPKVNIQKIIIQSSPFKGSYLTQDSAWGRWGSKGLKIGRFLPGLNQLMKVIYYLSCYQKILLKDHTVPQELVDTLEKGLRKVDPKGVTEFALEFLESDYSERMKKVPYPTLVVACEEDTTITPDSMKELNHLLPHSHYTELSDLDHYALAYHPRILVEPIKDFLLEDKQLATN